MFKYIEPAEYEKYGQLIASALDVYEEKGKFPDRNPSIRMLLLRLKEGGVFADVLTEASRSQESVTITIKRNLKSRLEEYRKNLLKAPTGTFIISTFKLETKYHDLRTRQWPCYMTTEYLIVKDPLPLITSYKERYLRTHGMKETLNSMKNVPRSLQPRGWPLSTDSSTTIEGTDNFLPESRKMTRTVLLHAGNKEQEDENNSNLETNNQLEAAEPASPLLILLKKQIEEERQARQKQEQRIQFLESELQRAFSRLDSDRITIENFLEYFNNISKKKKRKC